MAVKLLLDEHKWLLKSNWKVKNDVEVQRRWRVEFGTPPRTVVTITRIRNKFEVDWTVQDVLKSRCGRKKCSIDNESPDTVMQVFARSPKKSLRQCSHEIDIEKSSVHRILRTLSYSISNNPDGMSPCSTSLLELYCDRRWKFWTCTGLKKFKE